jgi:Alpha-galactosidase, CBM13 domain
MNPEVATVRLWRLPGIGTRRTDAGGTPRPGPRPLTIFAICCVVAVVAVVVTRAVALPPYESHGAVATLTPSGGDEVDAATSDQPDGSDSTDTSDDSTSPEPSPTPAPPPAAPPGPPPAGTGAPGAPGSHPGHATAPPTSAPPSPAPSPSPAPPASVSYEAESSTNTLTGATVVRCSGCSAGKKVGHVGRGTGTLRFNKVGAVSEGAARLTIAYVNGDPSRTATLRVNGADPITIVFPGTGGWNTVGTVAVEITVRAGANTLEFGGADPAPDFDKIMIAA